MLGHECEQVCRIQNIVEGEALDIRLAFGQRNICSPECPTTVSCEWVRGVIHVKMVFFLTDTPKASNLVVCMCVHVYCQVCHSQVWTQGNWYP